MAIPAGKYTIKSATGPYLGMNGSGITRAFSSGVGSLFCSNDPNSPSNPALQFYITPVAEDTNIYTIQSVAYPGVYLRMDGSGLTGYTGPGGGVVNCQFGAASYEKFRIVYNADKYAGMFSIGSQVFSFVYLRVDGENSVINCQYGAYSYEVFTISAVPSQ